ncbi:MAG: acetate kinase [Deltaproteobacteria bacterium]|nr:acetate kinase [Deltaproteobacteria bacterium]
MKILVINTGSSSIKYELFDMAHHRRMASGMAEKIGEDKGHVTHRKMMPGKAPVVKSIEAPIPDHAIGMHRIVDFLMDPEHGVIRRGEDIAAVGHRVVHGGERFSSTTIIDREVISAIRENIPLAPVHNPFNLIGIEVAASFFPNARQVAVFDTAFHQTLPERAFLYAIPFDLYKENRVRRYGFHGISHAYVAEQAAAHMDRPLEALNMISIHLGNGASMAAIKGGKSIDTSMGMTPLAGLVMGSRSGDVDPSLPLLLAGITGMSHKDIETVLNTKSGLKGLCGSNDMRDVISRMEAGDDRAAIAIDVYAYRIRKYIGAYFAALEHLDAVIFTAGIGENAPLIRDLCCRGLNRLGIAVDPKRNLASGDGVREISPPGSEVKVLVIPTDEELKIARETLRMLEMDQ